jgi:hypothetical protein
MQLVAAGLLLLPSRLNHRAYCCERWVQRRFGTRSPGCCTWMNRGGRECRPSDEHRVSKRAASGGVRGLVSSPVGSARGRFLAGGARVRAGRSSCSSSSTCVWFPSRPAPCSRTTLVPDSMRFSYVMHRHAVKASFSQHAVCRRCTKDTSPRAMRARACREEWPFWAAIV